MSSLVEVEPYSLSVVEPATGVEQMENRREVNLLHLAWRNRWLLLLCMILGGAGGWVALQRVTPLYTSVSRIFVERNLPRVLAADMQVGQSVSYLHTQAELIRSTKVLGAAAEAAENAHLKTFREVGNRVGFLKKEVQVTVGSQDDIINVSLELADPGDAARLVNSVVNAYITEYAEQRKNTTVEVLDILRSEKRKRDDELEGRRVARDEFRKANPELAVQVGSENVISRRFAVLADELNETELALIDATARYNRVDMMYKSPRQRVFLVEMAKVAEGRGYRTIDRETQIEQLERSLTAERAKWGEGHPRVKMLRETLADTKGRMDQQENAIVEAYVENVRQEYLLLRKKRDDLLAQYESQYRLATDVSSKADELASLEEALKRTERLCDILDDRIKEVNLAEDVGAMNVSIMELAIPSDVASYPVRARFLASGILLGGLLGFGLAWLRDLLDHRLRSVEEIAAVLQLPVLGALPHFGDKQDRAIAGRIVATAPRSVPAEAMRTLRTALHFGLAGRDAKIIVVTSPSPGDGKSTVASNLAIAMAQADQHVLLIDADMRKPTQHTIFQVDPERGLGSVLADRRPVEEAILPSVVGSLDLLACGPLPNNPVELLNNGFFADLLDRLKEKYDKIVIDSPPVMPVADARVIATLGDATLIVLRAERSTRRMSLAARNELWRVRATRLGVVVNGVPQRKQGHYGYGEYGYSRYGGYGTYGAYGSEELPDSGRSKRAALPSR